MKEAEASMEDGQASQGTDADGPPLPCSDGACTPWSDLWSRKMITVPAWGIN